MAYRRRGGRRMSRRGSRRRGSSRRGKRLNRYYVSRGGTRL